jgi:hypothetical protein
MNADHDPTPSPARPQPNAPERTEILSDGGLFNPADYMDWGPTDKKIRLDGSFTTDELIWIAEHMKSNRKPK